MLLRLALTVVVLGVLGTGCSGDGDEPAAAPTSAPAASGSSGPASASATPAAELPTGCDSMLPFTDLDRALGRPLFGQTVFTKGVAQPSIGRTGRVTCGYGIPRSGKGPPPVEVGVSTYTDVESATRRVQATISSLRSAGATQADATVSGLPATVLGTGTSLTLVLAQGSRTVAVTVQRTLHIDHDRAVVAIAERVTENLGR